MPAPVQRKWISNWMKYVGGGEMCVSGGRSVLGETKFAFDPRPACGSARPLSSTSPAKAPPLPTELSTCLRLFTTSAAPSVSRKVTAAQNQVGNLATNLITRSLPTAVDRTPTQWRLSFQAYHISPIRLQPLSSLPSRHHTWMGFRRTLRSQYGIMQHAYFKPLAFCCVYRSRLLLKQS